MNCPLHISGGRLLALGALLTVLAASPVVCHAQTGTAAPVPPLPNPATPEATNPAEVPVPLTREAELEARVQQLEAMVRDLSDRMSQAPQPVQGAMPPGAGVTADGIPTGGTTVGGVPNVDLGAPEFGPPEIEEGPSASMPAKPLNLKAGVKLGPGFDLLSEDGEYQLQFHDLTQFDGRFYEQGNQSPVHDTFVIPRQWFIFSGRLTKPLEFYTSLAEGFDNVNILDVFLNIHYDDRLQFKLGRYKTPFTYEFYNGPINGLIQPERSLFFNNFGLNRDLGMMAWGQLFDRKLDYAAGIFNGTRNGFIDANDSKDFAAYVNVRPFEDSQVEALKAFNIGGSVETGNQFNVPIPQTLRTNVATTGNLTIGPEFLSFNPNVRESGWRAFWSLHAAWYYNHLSVIGEWQSGFQDYAMVSTPQLRTHLPVDSFYVQAGYFLTGETVSARGMVKPLKPFDLRKGKFGLGAFELAARYNPLNMGNEVFTNGLANPNDWTNSLYTTDVGFNWYWTQFVKMTFTWEHAVFGNPVLYNNSGGYQLTSDMFLLRWQVYF